MCARMGCVSGERGRLVSRGGERDLHMGGSDGWPLLSKKKPLLWDDALKELPIDFAGGDTGRRRADSSSSSLLPSASAGKAGQEEKRVDES